MLPSVTRHQRTSFSTRAKFTLPPSFAAPFVDLEVLLPPGRYRGSASVTRHQVVASSSSQPNSHSISHVMAASLSANVRNRRRGSENHTDRERQKSTHSRRSASVGTVGKHLFFDSVLNRCRGFARSPEIIAGNPCRNGSVYGNPAYEAFPCVHPSPIRVSVPLLLRPLSQKLVAKSSFHF